MPQFLTVKQICEALHLSRSRIYQLVAAGEFPRPHKLSAGAGGRVIWPREVIEAWVASKAPKQRAAA